MKGEIKIPANVTENEVSTPILDNLIRNCSTKGLIKYRKMVDTANYYLVQNVISLSLSVTLGKKKYEQRLFLPLFHEFWQVYLASCFWKQKCHFFQMQNLYFF